MAAIVYPLTLPGPSQWLGSGRERRALSSLPGNTQLRNRTRDALNDIDAGWMYDSAQMVIWRAWYEATLLNGQLWFAATAPGVGGFVTRVVKFRTKTLKLELLGNGVYRVNAQLQQRGISAVPDSRFCVVENFSGGLGPYTTLSGSGALFTIVSSPYGQALRYTGTTSGTVSAIRRSITPASMESLSVKFLVESASVDDGAVLVIEDVAHTQLVAVITRRESAFDAAQRVKLFVAGESLHVGSAAAALNVWHELAMTFAPGAGNTSYSVTRLDTMAVLGSGVFTGNYAITTAGYLKFNDDAALGAAATRFADISICSV